MAKSTFWEKLETYVIVTIIAVLIWLHAEEKSVTTYANELVRVEFVAPVGQTLDIDPYEPQAIEISFETSKVYFQAFEKLMAQGPLHLEVDPPPADGPFNQTIVLAEKLKESALAQIGITGIKANPRTLELTVEPLVTIEMSIKPDSGDVALADQPTINPATVSVTLKKSHADRTEGRTVIALLDPEYLQSQPFGQQLTTKAVLVLPNDLKHHGTLIEPQTVDVTFTISSKTDNVTLPTVPIYITAPPHLFRQYDIILPDEHQVVPNVELSGPSDIIEQIRQGQIKIVAEIRPTAEELENDMDAALVEIQVPPGVTVVSPPAHTVPIIVTPRTEP